MDKTRVCINKLVEHLVEGNMSLTIEFLIHGFDRDSTKIALEGWRYATNRNYGNHQCFQVSLMRVCEYPEVTVDSIKTIPDNCGLHGDALKKTFFLTDKLILAMKEMDFSPAIPSDAIQQLRDTAPISERIGAVRQELLNQVIQASSPVGQIRLSKFQDGIKVRKGTVYGTGFLVTSRFMLTSAHTVLCRKYNEVTPSKEDQERQLNSLRFLLSTTSPMKDDGYTYQCSEIVDIDRELDYALLSIEPFGQDKKGEVQINNLHHWNYVILPFDICDSPTNNKINKVNYIYVGRSPQKNYVINANVANDDVQIQGYRRLGYYGETTTGSSGAPLFDNTLRLVGIHIGQHESEGIGVGAKVCDIINIMDSEIKGQIREFYLNDRRQA